MPDRENLRRRHLREKDDLQVRIHANRISRSHADQLYREQSTRHQKEIMELESGRRARPKTAQEKLIAMRNQARLRVEAISAAQREEQRQIQATRRVFQGEVVSFSASTRLVLVRLPGGQVIPGRLLGRGAPVGSKVVITIPLGSAIATIQTPEPRC